MAFQAYVALGTRESLCHLAQDIVKVFEGHELVRDFVPTPDGPVPLGPVSSLKAGPIDALFRGDHYEAWIHPPGGDIVAASGYSRNPELKRRILSVSTPGHEPDLALIAAMEYETQNSLVNQIQWALNSAYAGTRGHATARIDNGQVTRLL